MKSGRKRASAIRRKLITRYAASLMLVATLGCASAAIPRLHSLFVRDHPLDLDSIAATYVRVALELGERDPDSLDFAAVPSALREAAHRRYPSYDVIIHETEQLLASILSLPTNNEQRSRAQFLAEQLQATRARIVMLQGHTLDFASEAHILFQTERLPDQQQKERAVLRAHVVALLPSSTRYQPAEAYSKYTERFLIPPDHLPAVMTAALSACRQKTLAHLTLPSNESVDLTFVSNKPWSAFSRFHGDAHSTIEINISFPITVDQALELACHEGYPGHHVFNTLREIALAQQKHLPEAEVQLTFSPQSYVSESAAAYAPRLAFSDQERTRIERDILFPLAGLSPAEAERYTTICALVRGLDTAEPAVTQRYLDGELEFVRAAQEMRSEMLMEHPEATLLYLNEYRSYMLAYTDGPRRVAAYLQQATDPGKDSTQNEDAIWKQYAELTGNVLTHLPTPPESTVHR